MLFFLLRGSITSYPRSFSYEFLIERTGFHKTVLLFFLSPSQRKFSQKFFFQHLLLLTTSGTRSATFPLSLWRAAEPVNCILNDALQCLEVTDGAQFPRVLSYQRYQTGYGANFQGRPEAFKAADWEAEYLSVPRGTETQSFFQGGIWMVYRSICDQASPCFNHCSGSGLEKMPIKSLALCSQLQIHTPTNWTCSLPWLPSCFRVHTMSDTG